MTSLGFFSFLQVHGGAKKQERVKFFFSKLHHHEGGDVPCPISQAEFVTGGGGHQPKDQTGSSWTMGR